MLFNIALYVSLTLFIAGVAYKFFGWVHRKVGPVGPEVGTGARITTALFGIGRTLFSVKFFKLLKAFVTEVLLQFHFLRKKKNPYVWCMHMCLSWGVGLLLLMHALQFIISEQLFENYLPTLNPFFFLRDLFGAVVLVGLVMAVLRRVCFRSNLPPKSITDHLGIIIVSAIILSGFALESLKITSPTIFKQMVEDYADHLSAEEVKALEAYWVDDQGLVSTNDHMKVKTEILPEGADIHQQSCVYCHADAQWAFAGYTLSRLIRPFALAFDRINLLEIMWYLHFLTCFAGLAYLPFQRMFHVIATPVSMLANIVSKPQSLGQAALANFFSLERDGCLHGGSCHIGCSVQNARSAEVDEQKAKEPMSEYLEHSLKLAQEDDRSGL